MSKKVKDAARFEGNGISYRAKIIGVEDVEQARGDQMCQETIQKLKAAVKASGQHKQRVFMNVTLEGLKIIDGVAMTVLHTHPVHQISFISRDVTDSRAFGYIFGPGDGTHKFFGIKTANAAENLVLCLRDLFQTVYEMKKQEIEEAKAKAAAAKEGEGEDINTAQQTPPDGQAAEGQESIYQVPKNNAPVNPQEQEATANLLDLEDQVDTILKGIEQIKNLEFDSLPTDEAPRQPPSSTSTAASPTSPPPQSTNDPWGATTPAANAAVPTPASSSLSDLQQLSSPAPAPVTNPFGGMAAFPGTPAPTVGITAPGFGMVPQGMGQPGMMGYPVAGQQRMVAPGVAPFGGQFGQPAAFGPAFPGQPFPGAMGPPGAAGLQPAFGRGAAGFAPFGMVSPAAGVVPGAGMAPAGGVADPFQSPPENLLQPMKAGKQEEEQQQGPKSPGRGALFGDLLDIKKSAGEESSHKSPKEMFKELAQPPKKSLNEIKAGGDAAVGTNPQAKASPFGDAFS